MKDVQKYFTYTTMINKLYINDNLDVMNCLPDISIDHIITDPPYSTSNKKLSYKDTFKSEQEWIDFITSRIKECPRILVKIPATMLIFISQRYDGGIASDYLQCIW